MTPYTYLIGWPELNQWYYGVRYATGCHPSDLWNPYTTSSKHVKEFISLHGNPTIIEIRRIFKNPTSARRWENKVLKRIKVVSNIKWLNKTDNISIEPLHGADHPSYGKRGELSPIYGIKRSSEFSDRQRQNWIDNNPMKDPIVVAKVVASKLGNKHHMKRPEIAAKVTGNNNYLHKNPDAMAKHRDRVIKMNTARKGMTYHKLACPHCNIEVGINVYKRHERICNQISSKH